MTIKNGDLPAIPQPDDQRKDLIGFYNFRTKDCIGLTKREQFAMEAMKALIPVYWHNVEEHEGAPELMKCLMESSVEHADALLAELERTNA